MTDDQIKHMVDRFLGWRLPDDFSPDDGISFDPVFNKGTPYEMRHEPTGTNLFDAMQAEQMVRHMIEALPERGDVKSTPRIKSSYAILDVEQGRKALAKYLRENAGLPVVIHAVITDQCGHDDGTSIEFNCEVLKVEAGEGM